MWDANVGTTDAVPRRGDRGRRCRGSSTSRRSTCRQHPRPGRRRDVPARPCGEGFLSWYDETKFRAHEVAEARIDAGAPVVIVMPSQVYGPGDHSGFGEQLQLAYAGRLPYRALGDAGIGLVHVDDLAAGIVAALDRGRIGESYNLAGAVTPLGEAVALAAKSAASRCPARHPRRAAARDGAARRPGRPARTCARWLSASAGVTYLGGSAKAEAELGFVTRGRSSRASRDTFAEAPDLHSDPWPASSRCSTRPRAHHAPSPVDDLDRDGRRPVRPRRRRHDPAPPPPRLDQGADAVGRQLPRPQGPASRPQPQHRVRGGPLPQHRGLLGPAHGHGHDPGRRLHPGLRLLRDQDRQAHLVRRRRAAPGRRGRRGHAPRARRRHLGRPGRPARRRRRRLRRHDPRAAAAQPGHGRRGADPRLQRRGGAAAHRHGGGPGHPQPQPRDGPPPAEAGPQARALGPHAGRARAREGVRGASTATRRTRRAA